MFSIHTLTFKLVDNRWNKCVHYFCKLDHFIAINSSSIGVAFETRSNQFSPKFFNKLGAIVIYRDKAAISTPKTKELFEIKALNLHLQWCLSGIFYIGEVCFRNRDRIISILPRLVHSLSVVCH
jgi:hypothetical protein